MKNKRFFYATLAICLTTHAWAANSSATHSNTNSNAHANDCMSASVYTRMTRFFYSLTKTSPADECHSNLTGSSKGTVDSSDYYVESKLDDLEYRARNVELKQDVGRVQLPQTTYENGVIQRNPEQTSLPVTPENRNGNQNTLPGYTTISIK